MVEKSVSQSGGWLYNASCRIVGFFPHKTEVAPSVHPQCPFTLSEHFCHIPGMIAKFGKDSDICPYIDVTVGGRKDGNNTTIGLKLSLIAKCFDGQFRYATLRARFTDANGDPITIPEFFSDGPISVNPTSVTKNVETKATAGVNVGWQNLGINLGFERNVSGDQTKETYDMTAEGAHNPDYDEGIRWNLVEGEKCGLVNYTCTTSTMVAGVLAWARDNDGKTESSRSPNHAHAHSPTYPRAIEKFTSEVFPDKMQKVGIQGTEVGQEPCIDMLNGPYCEDLEQILSSERGCAKNYPHEFVLVEVYYCCELQSVAALQGPSMIGKYQLFANMDPREPDGSASVSRVRLLKMRAVQQWDVRGV
ncbi:hypothetical protein PILCRDRAFT_92416 [Piloderma croceum F 1598]|uniref:Uncharacterized protein n=1 Tax=Piloderma croceum (strain F 1598) TaxID=765440 RepID=A0A0C3EQF4_PILCF|nr:hypothetical protein PILCRDRAFT_92416 [Piloderma croceum F 1598]